MTSGCEPGLTPWQKHSVYLQCAAGRLLVFIQLVPPIWCQTCREARILNVKSHAQGLLCALFLFLSSHLSTTDQCSSLYMISVLGSWSTGVRNCEECGNLSSFDLVVSVPWYKSFFLFHSRARNPVDSWGRVGVAKSAKCHQSKEWQEQIFQL